MGISTHVYTVYGVNLPYDDNFTDFFYEGDACEKIEGVITDGMGGEYMVLGAILFDSGDARWEPLEGFEEIDISSLDAKWSDFSAKFSDVAVEWGHLLNGKPKLMTFVHYS